MTVLKPSRIDLYIGAPIDHESERTVLRALVDLLGRRNAWLVVLANVNVNAHQLDFIVATEALTLVVEAKSFPRSIRGQENGQWETKGTNGKWKKIGNAYLQALKAKNALRDRMRDLDYGDEGYPDACVVMTANLPAGSDLTCGDFKVRVLPVGQLGTCLGGTSSLRLTHEQWQGFAERLGLEPLNNIEAAFSLDLLDADRMRAAYVTAFQQTYGPVAANLLQDTYLVDEVPADAAAIVEKVVHGSQDILIRGPSGCGKSLLSAYIGVESTSRGCIPILLAAKHYDGRLVNSLNLETSLLNVPDAKSLIKAARKLDSPLVLVIDGYNECPPSEQLFLTRSASAAALRYGARVVVASQEGIVRPDLLKLQTVEVKAPSMELRSTIAKILPDDPNNDGMMRLLDSVSTGLEAELVGRVGSTIVVGASRFALFDAFARQRLGSEAHEGIDLLARVAGLLIERLSFGLSVRDYDRLADSAGTSRHALQCVTDSNLLVNRGGRISFVHELFFTAFSAEFVIRESKGNAQRILDAIKAPRYHACKALIVGAIDDPNLLLAVLSAVCDNDVLHACSGGQCGGDAQQWIDKRCTALLAQMAEEAENLRFEITGQCQVFRLSSRR